MTDVIDSGSAAAAQAAFDARTPVVGANYFVEQPDGTAKHFLQKTLTETVEVGSGAFPSPSVGTDVAINEVVYGADRKPYQNVSGGILPMPAAFPATGFVEYFGNSPVARLDTNTTWTVGTDYPTVREASIAALNYMPVDGVTLRIDIPAGTYTDDFPIAHPSRNVKFFGAAMTGAFPVLADFQVTAYANGAARNADLAAQEAMLRSRFATIFECSTGDAFILAGQNMNMSRIALINTGDSDIGVNLGGRNISFESGNGSFFAGDQISIHGFETANVSTEYGGAATFTNNGFTTSGSPRGTQLQYGGIIFAIGHVCVSNLTYGTRYKRDGTGYYDGSHYAGNGTDVSHINGGTHHAPNCTHAGSGRLFSVVDSASMDISNGTATIATTSFAATFNGLFSVDAENFSLTMTSGTIGIQGGGGGCLRATGLNLTGAQSAGVSNEGCRMKLENATLDSNGVNILHTHGFTDLTGSTLTNPTGGIGGVTADIFILQKGTGQVLGTSVGTPVINHRNSNNSQVGATNTMSDTGSIYIL